MNVQQIELFQAEEGEVELTVNLKEQTVWLSQEKMALLFGAKRPAITKHLGNIFKGGELEQSATCSILEHAAEHGQHDKTQQYKFAAVTAVAD